MNLMKDEKSLFLKQLDQRTSQFRRNKDLEELLDELSHYLSPIENRIEERFTCPKTPPLFLVGNPRSGTSLFMQFLSLLGGFAVPSNLLSRFYYAPYLGAKIQELLTNPKYDYKNEMGITQEKFDIKSDIGKSEGMLAPSEFFHFWRRFLPRYDPEYLNKDDLKRVDIQGLQKGIASIESVFKKPFAAKAIIIQYNLDILINGFPNCLFVFFRRQEKFVMQSIYQARKRFYGDIEFWWSVKPKEYEILKDMDVYHQIAGQVFFTENSIAQQLNRIHEKSKLIFWYEDFCLEPNAIADVIIKKYSELGYELELNLPILKNLKPRNQIRIPVNEMELLENAYKDFQSNS